MAHTSTSPNYQILASLDLGRRQVALEGVELVQRQIENAMQLRDAIDNHPLLSKYMACLRTSDLIPDEFRPSHIAPAAAVGSAQHDGRVGHRTSSCSIRRESRLSIGRTGYDGDTFKREQLMDRHGVQINKTSRNTVLFMTNIGTTRSSVAFLVEVLVKIARELDERISEMGLGERGRFEQRVRRLTASSTSQPDFSGFHEVFRDHSGAEADARRRRPSRVLPVVQRRQLRVPDPTRRSSRSWTPASTWCQRHSSRRIRPDSRCWCPGSCSAARSWRSSAIWTPPKSTATNQISGIGCTPRRRSRRVAPPSRSPPTGIG